MNQQFVVYFTNNNHSIQSNRILIGYIHFGYNNHLKIKDIYTCHVYDYDDDQQQ